MFPILTNRQADRQTDRQRWTDKQTNGQTDKDTYRVHCSKLKISVWSLNSKGQHCPAKAAVKYLMGYHYIRQHSWYWQDHIPWRASKIQAFSRYVISTVPTIPSDCVFLVIILKYVMIIPCWTENSPHFISISYILQIVVLLWSVDQAPSYEPTFILLTLVQTAMTLLSMSFILWSVQLSSKMNNTLR